MNIKGKQRAWENVDKEMATHGGGWSKVMKAACSLFFLLPLLVFPLFDLLPLCPGLG